MIEKLSFYLHSPAFRDPLGIPAGAEIAFSVLGQGEYNLNYRFLHPVTGQSLVLRINTGSQMHLSDQIGYEYAALCQLAPSGRTPRPLFCDRERALLVMEWLPGRPLCYARDMQAAAEILADIHALPVSEDSSLIRPAAPARAIYQECLEMVEHYYTWADRREDVCRFLRTLVREIGQLPLDESPEGPVCIVNTELNSGNFLVNEGGKSYLIDWEKPLQSEPAQDLGHFLAPTTTFWKTDTILTPDQVRSFADQYVAALDGRLPNDAIIRRLPLYFTVTCLRGITWCAMALREYSAPGRALVNTDTFRKLKAYMDPAFLSNILDNYVRRDFLR